MAGQVPIAPALVPQTELAAMFTQCGIDLPSSHTYLMDVEGIDSTTSLLLLSTKDIVELAKRTRFAPTPFALRAVQQKKLEALQSWVLDFQLCGNNIALLRAAMFSADIYF